MYFMSRRPSTPLPPGSVVAFAAAPHGPSLIGPKPSGFACGTGAVCGRIGFAGAASTAACSGLSGARAAGLGVGMGGLTGATSTAACKGLAFTDCMAWLVAPDQFGAPVVKPNDFGVDERVWVSIFGAACVATFWTAAGAAAFMAAGSAALAAVPPSKPVRPEVPATFAAPAARPAAWAAGV